MYVTHYNIYNINYTAGSRLTEYRLTENRINLKIFQHIYLGLLFYL